MRRRRWGRIVNMASDTFLSNLTGYARYIASKGGVIGLTRALASEFGEDGVTVNAIAAVSCARRTIGRKRRRAAPKPPTDSSWRPAPVHQAGLVPDDLVGRCRSWPATMPPSSPGRRST
jgi:3-oxoacyl-[acyl-carrier protein] reductase/(S)-1-phenylethanol dehydrogenase